MKDLVINTWKYLKIITLAAIPISLWMMPVNFFDKGRSISVFAFFGVEDYVYSTGMTRSIMHLMHFDFNGALEYNILSFFVLPLLFVLWSKLLLREFGIRILKWF
ncbi:MAG: hypothetical protein ACI87N_000638 [Flavobacteriales bacterium]|jgi:hypothetical protein